MIKVYYAYTGLTAEAELIKLVEPLPETMKLRLTGFRKEEDRLLKLTALYLLKKALLESGHPDYLLQQMEYTPAGKPFFAGASFDFSISHTDGCAAVAFSTGGRVGIDIEKNKVVDLSDFESVFSREVWGEIEAAADRKDAFYRYWTLLESAVKADGRGLSLISSNQIKITNGQADINGKTWFSQHQLFDPSISCCVAIDNGQETVELVEIKLV